MRMPYPDDEPAAIDLREFFAVLRRRKWSVILPTLLIVAAAVTLLYLRTPTYASTATVEVLPLNAVAVLTPTSTSYVNMDSEAASVTSVQIRERAARRLADGGYDPGLAREDDVSVSVPTNTTNLDITCTTQQPDTAQACAQAFAGAYVEERKAFADEAEANLRDPLEKSIAALSTSLAKLDDQLAATTDPVLRAKLSSEQTALQTRLTSGAVRPGCVAHRRGDARAGGDPRRSAGLALEQGLRHDGRPGLLLGLALGVGLAFVRQRMDTRVGEHEGWTPSWARPCSLWSRT